ncbi:hypothetical protein DdX_21219 [Ditylenchus destructor]|uniref:Uncharacterized protein n=1 Tax=Ditylenchus destructor TaxID=166010 RepID=A0AAD4MFB5_9BILA|nr:hypothetical protein DdX_21219 [Ditylenchus destructor]
MVERLGLLMVVVVLSVLLDIRENTHGHFKPPSDAHASTWWLEMSTVCPSHSLSAAQRLTKALLYWRTLDAVSVQVVKNGLQIKPINLPDHGVTWQGLLKNFPNEVIVGVKANGKEITESEIEKMPNKKMPTKMSIEPPINGIEKLYISSKIKVEIQNGGKTEYVGVDFEKKNSFLVKMISIRKAVYSHMGVALSGDSDPDYLEINTLGAGNKPGEKFYGYGEKVDAEGLKLIVEKRKKVAVKCSVTFSNKRDSSRPIWNFDIPMSGDVLKYGDSYFENAMFVRLNQYKYLADFNHGKGVNPVSLKSFKVTRKDGKKDGEVETVTATIDVDESMGIVGKMEEHKETVK